MVEIRSCPGSELGAAELYALLQLRAEVFVVEQDCPYQDLDGHDLDPGTLHVWVEDDAGRPRATVRVLDRGDGTFKVGRVVTRPEARGSGQARHLIAWVHDRLEGAETVLDAQAHLRRYYEGLGYQVTGPEFPLDGIPHLPMRRTPGSAGTAGPG